MIVCDWLLEVFDCPVVPLFQFEHVLHLLTSILLFLVHNTALPMTSTMPFQALILVAAV